MTGLDFLENMNDIEPELIESSENYRKNKNILYIKWLSVAAAFIFVLIIGAIINPFGKHDNLVESSENMIVFGGNTYYLASADELVEYGIVTSEVRTCREGDESIATKDDCGDIIGTIDIMIDGEKEKCNIYKHAVVESDNIRVVEYPDATYRIYVTKEK